ncbi:ATP-binding protein [Streptomyces sp. ASQP_92]|uniref:ATP-binding protein n=1 Tax=Streptomyces sp. ASQP_92 TaxID=2979116 RepID=UPI0021BE5E6B|nr:ATP-binding protein [Streptomyces sp. ASQP_92]MCT9091609.1 ATP-binding protein [Streptomyces sp. ASQP_92]
MPTLVTRFALAGTREEVSPLRCKVVNKVRAWGVPLADETADEISLIASELVTNAVLHGDGPVIVTLRHRPGNLVIEVQDGNPRAPRAQCPDAEEEGGRGLILVGFLAARSGWEPVTGGKQVWAEIELPKAAPAVRASVLRQFFAARPNTPNHAAPESLTLAIA